jgi:hypothetical protein
LSIRGLNPVGICLHCLPECPDIHLQCIISSRFVPILSRSIMQQACDFRDQPVCERPDISPYVSLVLC